MFTNRGLVKLKSYAHTMEHLIAVKKKWSCLYINIKQSSIYLGWGKKHVIEQCIVKKKKAGKNYIDYLVIDA